MGIFKFFIKQTSIYKKNILYKIDCPSPDSHLQIITHSFSAPMFSFPLTV